MFADIVQQHVSATYRATASNRQTKALASVILCLNSLLFIVIINILDTKKANFTIHIASVMITFSWTLQGSILVFLQVLSRKSMPDDILAVVKFYLPIQYGRVATEQHVNGKVT